MQTGMEIAQEAVSWAKHNRKEYKAIKAYLVDYAHNPVKFPDGTRLNVTRSDVYSNGRRRGWHITVHGIFAGLVRVCIMQRPCIARVYDCQKSKLDEVDLVALWKEEFPNDFFAARSVQEAYSMAADNDIAAR